MKATETNLLEFLKQPKQFVIPIYQRTYSWTLTQCQQLWNDIAKLAQDSTVSGHFLGSVVYIENGLYHVTSLPKLLIIDGQQRLTTISLLLKALGQAIENSTENIGITNKKINNYFLLNQEEEGEDRYKLLLTRNDKDTFINLIENFEIPNHSSLRVQENYDFFCSQINKNTISISDLYSGISKLLIVDISLDRERDNPQLIFESLNSTGLELSQADLIRNYILMGLHPEKQTKLYNHYWYPMEQSFGQINYSQQFDKFMRYYLTVKSKAGSLPNIRDVYTNFKSYVQRNTHLSIEEIVQDIYRFSKYFINITCAKEADKKLKRIINNINHLKVDVAYPFLLEIYDDYHSQLVPKEDVIKIFQLVESYVFRRSICGIPTNSMNKTFASLTRGIDKSNYLESVEIAFSQMTSYKRFPNNLEFCKALEVKDVYNFRNCNYLLLKLENHNRTKELIDVENYTIEHIIPQNPNLSSEWQQDLGENWQEIQARYLHTIGNLTLTGHNSKLSDRPFIEKRNIEDGFSDSPLHINKSLARLDIWNEQEVQNRAIELAELATNVWSFPSVDFNNNIDLHNISNQHNYEQYLQGEILKLFEDIKQEILDLDISIKQEFKKKYIAYKANTNFVDIAPQRNRLRLYLNMAFAELQDPQNICRDVTNVGHWGNGDVEVNLSSSSQIEDVMFLVRQAFQKHKIK